MLKTGLELMIQARKIQSPSEQFSLTVKKQGEPQGSLQRRPGGQVPGPTRGSHPSCAALSLHPLRLGCGPGQAISGGPGRAGRAVGAKGQRGCEGTGDGRV